MRTCELRSCYEVDCVFYEGQPPGRIRYYFVDEATPFLPVPCVFKPSDWDNVPEGLFPVGEVPGADRTWVNGLPPYPVAGTGPPCGSALDFQGLGTPPENPPPDLNQFGGLACCPLPEVPYVHFACPLAPLGMWSDYTLTPIGGDPLSVWGPALGHQHLHVEDPCELNGPFFRSGALIGRWNAFNVNSAGHPDLVVSIEAGPGPSLFWENVTPALWDPLSLTTVTRAIATPLAGSPSSLLIVPGLPPSISANDCVILGHPIMDHVTVRVPAYTGLGVWAANPADYPCNVTGPCQWSGRMWWRGLRFPGLPRLWSFREFFVVWTPGPRLAVLLVGPGLEEFEYLADVGDWDGTTPRVCMLQRGGVVVRVPDRVFVFSPDGPPPP